MSLIRVVNVPDLRASLPSSAPHVHARRRGVLQHLSERTLVAHHDEVVFGVRLLQLLAAMHAVKATRKIRLGWGWGRSGVG